MIKKFFNKNLLGNLKYIILSLITAVLVGTLLMIFVYSIDTQRINTNINHSLQNFENKTTYSSYAPGIPSALLDNYADTIMLNEAGFSKGNNLSEIVHNAMLNPCYSYDRLSENSLIKAYSLNEDSLKSRVFVYYYARYWHGYNIYLKPLLSFFTLSDILIFNMCIQLILLIALASELYKKGGKELLFVILSGIFILNPISSAICLQFSSMYYITIVSMYIMLKKEIYNSKNYLYFFLWVGIVTPFFDFLTYPLVGLGFNLILMQIITNNPLKERLKQIFASCFIWSIGYVGMWSGKWLIASLLTGNNVFPDAFNSVLIRMFEIPTNEIEIEVHSFKDVFSNNISAFSYPLVYILLIIAFIILLYKTISNKYYFKFNYNKIFSLLFVAILPFVWYFTIQNHSIVHIYMAHRNLSLTLMVLVYILISAHSKKEDVKKIG